MPPQARVLTRVLRSGARIEGDRRQVREWRYAFITQPTQVSQCSYLLASTRLLLLLICPVTRKNKCFRGPAVHLQIAQGSTAFPWKATPATSLWGAGDTKLTDRLMLLIPRSNALQPLFTSRVSMRYLFTAPAETP